MNSLKAHKIFETGIETQAIKMKPYWRIRFMAPDDEIDRLFDEIITVAPLLYGKTDRNAIRFASSCEYYRPLEGTPTGSEQETRKRPGVTEMALMIPPDEDQLKAIIDIIYQNHSYYEPPISVESILRSETRGLDDTHNPNRWWNSDGDWKKD